MNIIKWWKRETQCFFGHDWKQLTYWCPIQEDKDFDDNDSTAMALGECKKCGKREFQHVFGSHSWYGYEEKTKKEYCKKYNFDPITYADTGEDND